MNVLHATSHYHVEYNPNTAVNSGGADYAGAYEVKRLVENPAAADERYRQFYVVEFISPQYPEALAAAEQLTAALVNKPWEWADKASPKGSLPSPVAPDGSPVQ